jgi:hypothetical protein
LASSSWSSRRFVEEEVETSKDVKRRSVWRRRRKKDNGGCDERWMSRVIVREWVREMEVGRKERRGLRRREGEVG